MDPTTNAAKSSTTGNRHLVAVPYPGRGHINPMLNLCRLIASKSTNLTITFIVTEEWLGFLTDGSEPKPPPNFRFGVIPQVVPSEVGRAADITGFVEAVFTKLEAPVEQLLDRLEPPATALVCDAYLYWAVGVANRRGIPAAGLSTNSASMFNVLSHFDLFVQNGHSPLDISERRSEVVDYIPGLPPTAIADFPYMFHSASAKNLQRVQQSVAVIPNAQFLLLSSTQELEGPAIDAIKSKFSSSSTTILPIGPMIPYLNLPSPAASNYLRWLDDQPPRSVLYVSMGSFLSVSAQQMDEIVAGIVDSGVRYLFVTRGDESRFGGVGGGKVGERGCLVKWCDQLRVLRHGAVGGFWSHCGWNSTSEAMFAGVPVLAFPVMWDQLLNGKMVGEYWRIGRRVRGEGLVVTREEIGKVVREFMSGEMAAAAERVGEVCRRAVASGGSASNNLDAFVRQISGDSS